jgi:hypothetical protein
MSTRRRERRAHASQPGAESRGVGPRRCPRCRLKTLEFARRVVIVRPASGPADDDDEEDRKLRLRYQPAWLCQNEKCRYVKLNTKLKG